MKKFFKLSFLSFFIILLCLALSSCISNKKLSLTSGESDKDRDIERDKSYIYIAINPGDEPFSYMTSDGCYDGFCVAFAMKICEELERTPIFISSEGEDLYDCLNYGVAELSITTALDDGDKQKVDFSNEFLTLKSAIVTKKNAEKIGSLRKLSTQTSIGVISGSREEKYLSDSGDNENTVCFKTYAEAESALSHGLCDVLYIDEYYAKIMCENKNFKIQKDGIDEQKCAVAVEKGNTELLKILNEKINRFKTDGTLLSIRSAYLGDDSRMREIFLSEVKDVQAR